MKKDRDIVLSLLPFRISDGQVNVSRVWVSPKNHFLRSSCRGRRIPRFRCPLGHRRERRGAGGRGRRVRARFRRSLVRYGRSRRLEWVLCRASFACGNVCAACFFRLQNYYIYLTWPNNILSCRGKCVLLQQNTLRYESDTDYWGE